MKQLILLFAVLFLTVLSCNDREPDIESINTDSSITSKTEYAQNFKGLSLLKSIVAKENQSKKINSIKFFDTDAIDEFIFIRDLFPTEEIDSLEIYGTYDKHRVASKNFPQNSLVIIYFNHRRLARNQIKLMETEWNDNFIEARTYIETGTIVFELDKQACIYSVNNCNESRDSIERIDAIIKKELNLNSYEYERIITDCEKVSFKRKLN